MPNTFGPAGPPGTTAAGFPLVDPRAVRDCRERLRRVGIPELEWANCYYALSGLQPDVGWLLLDRASYAQIDPYAIDLQLVISDFVNAPLTVSNLTVVQAQCVTRGLASDPNAVYLVQVTNTVGALRNRWFAFPLNAQYNVRAPAYDGLYYAHSLDAGLPWTWGSMVGDLWGRASAMLGAYPGLPYAPAGAPEGFAFVGTSLADALQRVLDHLGMTVTGNYPNYQIVEIGAADAAFSALQAGYSVYLEDDMEYLDTGSGRLPGAVTVYFHRRNQYYGTEETVRRDAQQWQAAPAYAVSVLAPAPFDAAVGAAFLWDDFTVRYDEDGSPLAADAATAATIAAERATQYFATILRGTAGYMRQVYAGALPFTTGSLVDGVCWRHGGAARDRYGGWRTEVVRGYCWPEVCE